MRTLLAAIFCLLSCLGPRSCLRRMRARWKNLRSAKATNKLKPSRSLSLSATIKAAAILQALADGELVTAGKRILIVKGDSATDALTGEKLPAIPADKEDITVNNRLRRELAAALAALKLVSPQRDVRLAAAKELARRRRPGDAAAGEESTEPGDRCCDQADARADRSDAGTTRRRSQCSASPR